MTCWNLPAGFKLNSNPGLPDSASQTLHHQATLSSSMEPREGVLITPPQGHTICEQVSTTKARKQVSAVSSSSTLAPQKDAFGS